MPKHRSLFILPLALLACTDRPLGETETGTGSTVGTTGAPPVSTTSTATTTGGPGTTVAPTTSTTTGITTDDSATTVVTVTSDSGVKLDFGPIVDLVGCALDAPPGTMVSGDSKLGPFAAQRAYFGWVGFDVPWTPLILFVSPEADPAVEVEFTNGNTGPVYYGEVASEHFTGEGWIGTWPLWADVYSDGMTASTGRTSITIDAFAGNWDTFDPADPPRLVGSLAGEIAGPFDAVFCDKLNEYVIVE